MNIGEAISETNGWQNGEDMDGRERVRRPPAVRSRMGRGGYWCGCALGMRVGVRQSVVIDDLIWPCVDTPSATGPGLNARSSGGRRQVAATCL